MTGEKKEPRMWMRLAGHSLLPSFQLSFNNSWVREWVRRTTSGKERKIVERERKGSPANTGYARELKSLHASTVMYGDCACVTRLALCSVIRPFFLAAPRRHTDNHPLLLRYRNGHWYLFYTRVHAAIVKADNYRLRFWSFDTMQD